MKSALLTRTSVRRTDLNGKKKYFNPETGNNRAFYTCSDCDAHYVTPKGILNHTCPVNPWSSKNRPPAGMTPPPQEEFSVTAGRETKKEVIYQGIPINIQFEKGDIRTGKDDEGNDWEREQFCDYGEIPDTTGADKDPVDVYVGESPDANTVYVIEQLKKDGSFDEFKCMLGFDSMEDAEEMYLKHYPKELGEQLLGDIWEAPIEKFRDAASDAIEKTATDHPNPLQPEHKYKENTNGWALYPENRPGAYETIGADELASGVSEA
jgi:hypothetical protein